LTEKKIEGGIPVYLRYTEGIPKMSAILNLPKEDFMMFFNKHTLYQNASESKRAELLLDLLLFTYSKCGYDITKKLIDEEIIDNPYAKIVVLRSVMKMIEG